MGLRDLFKKKNKIKVTTSNVYSGPVPEGASEKIYRESGMTQGVSSLDTPSPPATTNMDTIKTGGGGVVKNRSSNSSQSVQSSVQQANNVLINKESSPIVNQNKTNREIKNIKIDQRQQENVNKLLQNRNVYGSSSQNKIQTLEEINRRNKLNENILTADTRVLSDKSSRYDKSVSEIIDLSSKNEKIVKNIDDIDKMISNFDKYIIDNQFVGSDEQYKQYTDLFKARDEEYKKYLENRGNYNLEVKRLQSIGGNITNEGLIQEPTIKVGIFGERSVPISKYQFSEKTPFKNVGNAVDIVGRSIFATSASGWKNILQTSGVNEKTSQKVSNVIYKGGSGAVSFGKYLVPYAGTTLFFGEVSEDVKKSGGVSKFVKENPLQTALIGASVFIPVLSKGKQLIKNRAIQKAVQTELDNLSKVPVKSLTLIDEGNGLVQAVGYREVNGITQEIRYTGKIKQTESGFKFIPEGKAVSVTAGIVKPKIFGIDLKPRVILREQGMLVGSKGKNIPLGNIGNVKVFEEVGKTTIENKIDLFGISKLGRKKPEFVSKNLNRDIIIDLQIPRKNDRNLFFKINNFLGLEASKRELGSVITIPKKEVDEGVSIISGGSKKSSSDFLTSLYTEQKVSTPQLNKISNYMVSKPVEIKLIDDSVPSMVGGSGKVSSSYFGQGTYERTDVLGSVNVPSVSSNSLVELKENIKTNTTEANVFRKIVNGKSKETNKVNDRFKEILDVKPNETFKFNEVTKQGERLKQVQRTRQEQVNLERLTNILNKARTNINVRPKIKIPFDFGKQTKPISTLKESNSEFDVFGKRFGKDILLKKTKSKREAVKELEGFLTKTLGASGKIFEDGKALDFEDTGLDMRFKPAKRDVTRIVQKSKFRLGSFGERREIQRAKKRKGKKDNWFSYE